MNSNQHTPDEQPLDGLDKLIEATMELTDRIGQIEHLAMAEPISRDFAKAYGNNDPLNRSILRRFDAIRATIEEIESNLQAPQFVCTVDDLYSAALRDAETLVNVCKTAMEIRNIPANFPELPPVYRYSDGAAMLEALGKARTLQAALIELKTWGWLWK